MLRVSTLSVTYVTMSHTLPQQADLAVSPLTITAGPELPLLTEAVKTQLLKPSLPSILTARLT